MSACVIFDLDGTLVDSAALCVDILNAMLAERGSVRTIHPAAARPYLSIGGTRMIAALLAGDGGDPEAEIADFRRRYAARATPPTSLFAGVREGLTALAERGHRLAVCSNKPQTLCEKVLADLNLLDRFEVVVGGRAGYRAKPAPDLLNFTLLRLRLAADACVFVGDSRVDAEAAAAAGVPFRFVSWGYAEGGWTPAAPRHDGFAGLVAALTGGLAAPPRRMAAAR